MIGTELLDELAGAGVTGWGPLLLAPFAGSFLGVIVRRLPEGRSIAWVRSRCEYCGAALRARDLVPLYSWLIAGGRCRYCGHPLGWFYPGIELAALAIALVALAADGGDETWLDCVFGWWLLALGWIDIRRWLLPDALTLPLVIAGLAAAAAFDPGQLTDRALGAALGYLGLRVVGAAVPSVARPRRAGPRRRQAAGGVGSLGRGNGPAAGSPWCRGLGAHRCRRPAARRGPTQRRLGSALWPVPRALDLARLAIWAGFDLIASISLPAGKIICLRCRDFPMDDKNVFVSIA